MIKTIELHNFQAHKSTSLNLSPGVNVIKGPSHNGKTAIIRALKWALANKPGGESFKSWFAGKKDEVSVAIEFDDGYIIRSKKGTKNGYKLKHNGEDSLELNAIGRDLPEEVSQISRMNDLNLQSQHDSYFMLQDSASVALQRLNEIVGLTIIDETLKAANQKNHRMLSELRSTETRIEEIEGEIKDLDYLEFAGKVIEKITEDSEKVGKYRKELFSLNNMLRSIESTEEQLEECDVVLCLEAEYEEAKMTSRHLVSIGYRKSEIIGVVNDVLFYQKRIGEYSKILESEAATLALLQTGKKIQKMESERVSIDRTCQSIRNLRKRINDASETLISTQTEYDQMLLDAGICPLCGNKIEGRVCRDHIT